MSSFINPLTELEDLRLFMQERIRDADPTIDTSLGSEFDTAVIQPLLVRLGPDPYNTAIREFIITRLKNEFPDLVLQDGEPLDDYLVKPLQILLEPFRRQIQQISNNQSLANPTSLNEREADSLAANYFAKRRVGGYSIGTARLYWSAPQYVLVNPINVVKTGSGLVFIPVESQAISHDDMLFHVEDNLYFFDVIVQAEKQGEEYNIDPNTLVSVDGLSSVVKVTNKRKFAEGGNKESTEDFLARVEQSLTEKSLVTFRGIRTRLVEIFDSIQLLQVIGFGDPEMMRDIIKGGSESAPYAVGTATTPNTGGSGTTFVDLLALYLNKGGTGDFEEVAAGDRLFVYNTVSEVMYDVTVKAVVSASRIELKTSVPDNMTGLQIVLMSPNPTLTLSDIPGGFADPNTTVEVESNTVHIGGMTDVFVRAGAPATQDISLDGVLDAEPLRFGIDLESFGEEIPRLVQITSRLSNVAMVPGKDRYGATVTDHVLVAQYDVLEHEYPWKITAEDKGRFIQLLVGTVSYGTFEILDFLGEEYVTDSDGNIVRASRIQVSLYDQESGATVSLSVTSPLKFTVSARLVESESIKNRVRDRDATVEAVPAVGALPAIMGGANLLTIGAKIGDSLVIETGSDAGIYSIRRILSWLTPNDTVVLDRELTTSHPATGAGDGLRYRIANELNVDLVSPKLVKIPLGAIFTGDDLNTVAGSASVSVSGDSNFVLAGVEVDDTLEIFEGDNKGTYRVTSVSSTSAILDRAVNSTSFSTRFSAYKAFTGIDRPLVRVKQVDLLDSNFQTTGVTIPYGKEVDVRVKGALSNRAQATEVESYTGETHDDGTGKLLKFTDSEISDFTDVDLGLGAGYRLNILNTANAGAYTIIVVEPTYLLIAAPANGGEEFKTVTTAVHYTIGLPSSGYARMYFQSPTSVEIQTGLAGGRLQTTTGTPKEFRFSEVDGYKVIPAPGSTESNPRDLRVIRTYEDPAHAGEFFSLVELTDSSRPGVYELELQDGDLLEVNQPVAFRTSRPISTNLTWASTTTVTGATANPDLKVGYFIKKDSDGQWFEISVISGNNITVFNPHGWTIPTGAGASSYSATFAEIGVFGAPAGLRTVISSNLVSVPNASLIDFQVMEAIDGLVGQKLIIDSGVDAGEYRIDAVVNAKQLRLDRVLTSATATVLAQGGVLPAVLPVRDPYLTPTTGNKTLLKDPTTAISSVANHYVTLFEGTREDVSGSFEISEVVNANTAKLDLDPTADIINPDSVRVLSGDQNDGSTTAPSTFTDSNADFVNDGVMVGDVLVITNGASAGRYYVATVATTVLTVIGTLSAYGSITYYIEAGKSVDPWKWGRFNWVRTSTNEQVEQPFHVYHSVPVKTEVVEVAPKRLDLTIGPLQGTVSNESGKGKLVSDSSVDFSSVKQGDVLEILDGHNVGVHTIFSVVGSTLTVWGTFSVPISGVPYRVWAGLHGSTRMLRVGHHDATFNGNLQPGYGIPYQILRQGVYRLCSTEMEKNFDGTLYYADVQIESQGSGDDLNLGENERMLVTRGVVVDGYTYVVDNNVLTFSPYEEVGLVFDRRFLPVGNSDSPENRTEVSGRNIKVTYDTSIVAGLVNDLMRSPLDRPVNSNPLGRHFLPSYVLLTINYSGGVSPDQIGPEIETYINSLGAEDSLEVSDVESFVTRRGATYVKHPIELVTITHDLDRQLVVNRSYDKVGGGESVPYNGSGRISAFFAKIGEGLTVAKS